MKKTTIGIITLSICSGIIISSSLILLERKNHFFSKIWNDKMLDNKENYVPCDKKPNLEKVDKVVNENKDILEKIIKEIGKRYRKDDILPYWDDGIVKDAKNSSYVWISWGQAENCKDGDSGEIIFWYLSHSDREIIEKHIQGDTFFGIPYKLRNM
jgi:hypothetical protein